MPVKARLQKVTRHAKYENKVYTYVYGNITLSKRLMDKLEPYLDDSEEVIIFTSAEYNRLVKTLENVKELLRNRKPAEAYLEIENLLNNLLKIDENNK